MSVCVSHIIRVNKHMFFFVVLRIFSFGFLVDRIIIIIEEPCRRLCFCNAENK